MTLCRKCGKEIPDGEELCPECQNTEENLSDDYLDELMQSMERDMSGLGIEEPVAEEPMIEQEPMLEEQTSAEEEPILEEASGNDEDINELLSLLSQDYEEIEEEGETLEPLEENAEETMAPIADEMPVEASLFSEEEDETGIFADESNALSVDDIFDDALSAIDYREAEQEEEVLEEFVSPEETEQTAEETLDDLMLDTLVLDENGVSDLAAEGETKTAAASVQKAEKKDSVWKRVFGNIITEQTAEEEAKAREAEQATADEKAAEKEERKKQAAAAKAEKAEQTRALKEKRAAEKAEQAAVKAAEKAEKKRLKMEAEANEVVGKINPVGASIVMVFFGLICVGTIIGSQVLYHASSVKGAENCFVARDYKGAYESLAGIEVEEDTDSYEMKDKIRICMQLQRQLEAYENYYQMKMYLEALDSLMKGIRSYDANQSKAERYDIVSQYNELEVKLAQQLYQEFGVSESQARNINAIEDQAEYTSRLENIIAQWEKRNREDER